MNVLLVQPAFPRPKKSRNHGGFAPIGLLKLAAYHRKLGDRVKLVEGCVDSSRFQADTVLISSLFTYWADQVRECVSFYRRRFPRAELVVGGIYASLMPQPCLDYTGCDSVFQGVHEGAEACAPAYDLVDSDIQILHASRGCPRRCDFCGAWRIEPEFRPKASIEAEIVKRRLVFYDNNFLANPHIEDILDELQSVRVQGRRVVCESQSGFDGRVLLQRPNLAMELKGAGFRYPRIAWDGSVDDRSEISEQLHILRSAGFRAKDTYVFMLYNWQIPFSDMERKRKLCGKWGVQIADCRYRPLDLTYDGYIPGSPARCSQQNGDYHIHAPVWTDREVRQFRQNVREQNIALRVDAPYSREKERAAKQRKRR